MEDEDDLYPGDENTIYMANYLIVRLGCKFKLGMYPFDSQLCPIKLIKQSEMGDMTLKWKRKPIIHNMDLIQYEVFPNLQYNNTNSTMDTIEVNITLRRKLYGHIFNIYIPTICLITIAGFTLLIDFSHFETTVMLALTTMLVTYTLHQSISANLPATAYLKMIDIWLFGALVVPFIIIGILIFLDYLVMREANQVIEITNDTNKQWKSKSFMKSVQIILPLTITILIVSYWIFGLLHYFA